VAKKLRILHVASEAVPLAKSGGLADVVGALPAALVHEGYDARIVMPGYRSAIDKAESMGKVKWLPDPLYIEAGGHTHDIHLCEFKHGKVRYYLLACPELYDRHGLYGPTPASSYEDNARRFSVLAKAALALPGLIKWVPHVIHAHDWQAGLVPVLRERGWNRALPATRTVFTVHNLAYQGSMWHFDIKLAGLDWAMFNPMQLEHHGKLNFLKAGIVFADRVTTVSQRYAEEIQGGELGEGLDAVLRHHNYKMQGIRNGIDTGEWNPETDPHIAANYSASEFAGKSKCKQALRYELGLHEHNTALVGVISRLVHQKGLDLVLGAVEPYILSGRMQLAVLGSGEPGLEHGFRVLQDRHPGWVCFWHGYNEGLSHRIEAGSDIFLMPSRFEPCGLNQMYSLRYGTLPVVRYTGGLADTVTDVLSEGGKGFTFGPPDVGHFSSVLDRALGLYQHFPEQFRAAQLCGMQSDFSWEAVAHEYEALYSSICVV